VYGQPPPGLDVRLSLDLDLQRQADELLGDHKGAIILMNAASGEILVAATHPTFDPNLLDVQANSLMQDPNSPLLNRVAQGMYPPGDALMPFLQAAGISQLQQDATETLYIDLGFYQTPELRLPMATASKAGTPLRVSPLQMVVAAATLSNKGIRPAPRLVIAVDTPSQGWIILPSINEPDSIFPSSIATETAQSLIINGRPFWQWNTIVSQDGLIYSWSLGGTSSDWLGAPLVVVVLLEENNPLQPATFSHTLLKAATLP
jgi:cell division protein FtsI/penicillin-binding protein 2